MISFFKEREGLKLETSIEAWGKEEFGFYTEVEFVGFTMMLKA